MVRTCGKSLMDESGGGKNLIVNETRHSVQPYCCSVVFLVYVLPDFQ